jgi:hypothetical protein
MSKVFVGWDKAQAEARVVAYKSWLCTGDDSYKKLIESKQKIHVWFAHRLVDHGVFTCPKECIKGGLKDGEQGATEYYISKVGVHANSYDMMEKKFCQVIAKETDGAIIVQPEKARKIKQVLYSEIPAIPKWHREIQRHLSTSRVMVNAFGRSRLFFERWGDDLFREAYANEPQSTVADDVSNSIHRVWSQLPWIQVLQQNYDSLLAQCDVSRKDEALTKMKPLVEQPITLWDFKHERSCVFTIPVVMKWGTNWRDLEEI